MSAGKLVVKQVLGLSSKVKSCMTFVEDHHLAYFAGHQVVVINTETKEQNFIAGTSTYQHQSLGFTAIAASPAKKLIAVAEKVEPNAIVTFYDNHSLRKKRLLTYPEIGSSEIRSLSFSEDGKYLVTQGGSPEWNLVLWNVEKSAKVLCTSKMSLSDENCVNVVSFCPWDTAVVLVLGKGILRLFRFVEGQLRPLPLTVRKDQANFISHCWLPNEQLVVGTEAGELLMLENFEHRGSINPNKNDNEELYPILCLQATSRGFIMGTFQGEIKMFEKHEELKEKYQIEDSYIIPGDHGHVLEFAMGADEQLICGMSRHQLLTCSLSNLYNSSKENHAFFDYLFTPFHYVNSRGEGTITGIDVALWKQVVVTCGKDRTVRVWNPNDKKLELTKEFEEEPLSVTVHPAGIYIAVAFSDKIRILSILLEEIYLCREIPARQVSYVKFSKGGQYLAASVGTNLQIFNTFTGAAVMTLRGHNNRIKNVIWMNYDSRMITIGCEGVVYSWDLFPTNRRPEHFPGTVPIFNGAGPMDGSSVFVATHDKMIKELNFGKQAEHTSSSSGGSQANTNNGGNTVATGNNSNALSSTAAMSATTGMGMSLLSGQTNLEGVVKVGKSFELGTPVSFMIFDESRRLLLISTCSDDAPCPIVVTLTSPSLGGGGNVPILENNIFHSTSITALCLSYDGTTVYSGDENGCLVISEFESASFSSTASSGNNNKINKQRDGIVAFEFIEEVVIHKSDLENRKNQIAQLTHSVEELNKNNEHQMRLKELEYKDKLKEISEKFQIQLKSEKVKYDDLEDEKANIEREFNRKVKALEEKHAEELKGIELKYKTKQSAEENRHKILLQETEEAHRRWNEENEVLVNSHQKYLQELTKEYESKLVFEQKQQREIRVEKDRLQVQFDSLRNDTENDGDREVAEMKIRYDAKLKAEEETAQQLIQQHNAMNKNHEILVKESTQQKIEIKRLKDKEARLFETIHTLEKDIQSHKKEIREREETITDKEKRIFDLKKKNQELEKFRFVLDYKIKELKLQIAPRENEINTMRKQIEEMNLELEQYNKSNLALNLMIDELKLKIEGIRGESNSQDERCAISERFLEKFRRDLQELWLLRHDQNAFKAAMIKMYRVYVQEDVSPAVMGDSAKKRDLEDPQQVYNRDREQMERSLDSLRRAMKTEAMAHKRDLGKMMRESVMLTKELNTLRKNARSLQLQKKAIEQGGDLNSYSNLVDLMQLLGLQIKKTPKEIEKEKAAEAAEFAATQPTGEPPRMGSGSRKRNQVQSRTAALRTTSADGHVSRAGSRNNPAAKHDQWEAWREIQIQYDTMKSLEDQITAVCDSLNMDPIPVIVAVDARLTL